MTDSVKSRLENFLLFVILFLLDVSASDSS